MLSEHSGIPLSSSAHDWRRRLDPSRLPGAVTLYAIIGGLVCFWRLGSTGLVSMEGMVMDGARRMLATGEWVVPRIYGEIYTYKPPLSYWLASAPLGLAEDPSAALLRLPFAFCGFAMGLAVLLLIGRCTGWLAGLLCAVASVTGALFLLKARMAEFDVALAAGVGVAVAAACHNLSVERPRWGVWLLGYVSLGVGFLSKGVPALLVYGPGLLVAALLAGRFRRLLRWRHLSAVLLFVGIVGGVLWAAWSEVGPAAFEQPLVEARVRGLGRLTAEDLGAVPEADRFVGPKDGWGRGWARAALLAPAKPLLIWVAFMPWAMLLLHPLRRLSEAGTILGRPGLCAAGFLLAGTGMFMLTPTHQMRYYLPLAVPLGIVAGLVAKRLLEGGQKRNSRILRACNLVAVFCGMATLAMAFGLPSPQVPLANRLALSVAGALSVVASVYLLPRRPTARLFLLLGLASLCVLLTQVLGLEPYRATKRDMSPQAGILAQRLLPGETVWVLGPADMAGKHSSLLFYLNRPIRAFRPDSLPPAGVRCLLTSRDLERLEEAEGFAFREIDNVEHVWFTYHLGTCTAG